MILCEVFPIIVGRYNLAVETNSVKRPYVCSERTNCFESSAPVSTIIFCIVKAEQSALVNSKTMLKICPLQASQKKGIQVSHHRESESYLERCQIKKIQ